ncbi:MAG: EAL domain-containing protein [Actinobacteria bacterium]|nr:EAL domain-containing protein [Actinomycetota bacterium]
MSLHRSAGPRSAHDGRASTAETTDRTGRAGRTSGHRAFAPGRRVLATFGLVQRFAVVLLILTVPLTVISWGYVSGAAADRDFTEREIAGVVVLEATIDPMAASVDGRWSPAGNSALVEAQAALAAAVADHADTIELDSPWRDVSTAVQGAIDGGDASAHADAADALRDFIVDVGDRSNLTLDPELDSYYLMDAAQYRYPTLLVTLGEAEQRVEGFATSRDSVAERWSAERDLARLVAAELDALAAGHWTVADETDDPVVRVRATERAILASRRADSIDAAIDGVAADGIAADGIGTTDAALDAQEAALASMPTTAEISADWKQVTDELAGLLDARLDSMNDSSRRLLALALVCLAVALYLLLSLFSGLLRSLRDMRDVLARAGNGDLTARVRPEGSDELADVSRSINDTVASVAAVNAELRRRATHDGLTGLPNRGHFVELLQERMALARPGASIALAFVDLDSFKAVNDLHGHHNGDVVLRTVAERLQSATPSGTICSRLAGDEYALLLGPGVEPDVVRAAAQRVLGVIGEPIDLADQRVRIVLEGASLGLAFHDGTDGLDAEGLLAAADFAMYDAKSTAPGLVREFTTELAATVRRRASMRSELTRALAEPRRSGLTVAYQPIVDLRSQAVAGCEALARWTSPTLGVVSPAEFVPLAESIGLITTLGQYVLGEAAQQLARGQHHRPDLYMSVNVSALALTDGLLELQVEQAASAAGIAPETFWLELTESAMMVDPEVAARRISSIRRRGHPVAVDDFGTGYSSLAYLHSLELSALKVDRSFVESLDDPAAATNRHILQMTLELARHLGLDVIAEGIETQAQHDALVDLGVTRGQGFFMHRPMPGEALDALLGGPSAPSVDPSPTVAPDVAPLSHVG